MDFKNLTIEQRIDIEIADHKEKAQELIKEIGEAVKLANKYNVRETAERIRLLSKSLNNNIKRTEILEIVRCDDGEPSKK